VHSELKGEKRRLFKKLTSKLLHLYRNLASHPLEELHGLGSAVYTVTRSSSLRRRATSSP